MATRLVRQFSSQPWGAVNTVNRFLMCMDKGDSVGFQALFTPGGSCEIVKTNAVASGHAELASLCTIIHNKFKGVMHFEGNVTIQVTSEENICLNESYWQAIHNGQIISTGIHKDILEKQQDGQWLFLERKIIHTWTKDN